MRGLPQVVEFGRQFFSGWCESSFEENGAADNADVFFFGLGENAAGHSLVENTVGGLDGGEKF